MTDTREKKYINLPDLLKHLKEKGITVTETAETSLTSPMDRVNDEAKTKKQYKAARRVQLTPDELDVAVEKLVREWPQVEKRWADPEIPGQTYCSISFMPSSGANPDKDGIYGFVKVRGAFSNEVDRDAHAEEILNTVDSYHAINHGSMGQPLPLVNDNDDRFCLETDNVALRAKVKEEMAKNVKTHREEQKKYADEAEKRAKEIQTKEEAAARGEMDHEERYTTLRVKRANLIFTLYQMLTGMKRYKDTLLQTIDILAQMDKDYPTFQNTFMFKYNKAAEEVGLPTEKNHIIKYLVGDIPFDLSAIPDEVEVANVKAPLIVPMDVNDLDYHAIAKKMSEAGEKASQSDGKSDEKSQ